MPDLSDLRDLKTFPTFEAYPHENDLASDYYYLEDSWMKPKHRWCLLAEIFEASFSLRLRLQVRDSSGLGLPITFHLDNDDSYDYTKFHKGPAVAILLPHQHNFMGLTVGIHQQD
ncbi:MAG: hypothetical protein M1814_005103 [Vezdaea aestivalis]|nr:MAG: hypothetical protein M1814_005103 [Vezdaea aestivalis]